MKSKLLSSAFIILIVSFMFSCSKDTTTVKQKTELEKRADELQAYLTGKHFVPVNFYSDKLIDYNQEDSAVTLATDLTSFILPYLFDDSIVFESGGNLLLNQGDSLAPATVIIAPSYQWSVEFKKADSTILFNYLDYVYKPKKYTLDYFTEDSIKAHVSWTGGGVTANLYTVFEKR